MPLTAPYIKVCLNGGTSPAAHPAVPLTPDDAARDAARCAALGAAAIHVHPRLPDGRQTLEPTIAAATVGAIRGLCPRTPVGLTTSLAAEPDPDRRLFLVKRWTILPDFASVNLREPGALAVCHALWDRGIAVEAGVWTVEDAEILIRTGNLAARFLRVLVEVFEPLPEGAVVASRSISQTLSKAGLRLPEVHHGDGHATWAVLKDAVARGHGIRIGLEDTVTGPNGEPVKDNADLLQRTAAFLNLTPRFTQTPG